VVTRTKTISGELLELKEEIEALAKDYGLDFYPVIFEMCDYDTINILASQGGFPTRYPHWRFGMEYDQMSKNYAYGLQKIYEMVINTAPCYAYLLNVNPMVDQKIVMCHVYGHADFFKNNFWFKNTNKKMMDVMANHGAKIRRYMEKFGQDKVEAFIDRVLSLENLLDINILFDKPDTLAKRDRHLEYLDEEEEFDELEGTSQALKTFINSKNRSKKEKGEGAKSSDEEVVITEDETQFPTKDIMKFLMESAPIKEWESDIIGILREEAYYFLPQRITKIMNEGWASYWHSKMMTQKVMKASEVIDFADHHAGVTAMSRKNINPYKIGIELFRDIEYRWNTGKFGKEYLDCTDMAQKANWNTETNQGMEKIFEVRRTHNDITFIDEFFTKEFCERQKLFTYKFNNRTGRFEIDSKEFQEIKMKLLNSLTNFGSPVIELESANYKNRGELLLRHVHQGVDLDINLAQETMKNIFHIWKRPINLATISEEKESVLHFDGQELKPELK